MKLRRFILAALLLPSLAQAFVLKPREFDFGPLASRQKDANGEWHTRAAGPIFDVASGADEMNFLAVRPFYSQVADPARDRTAEDYLWPLATARSLKDESNWRCLIFFGFNHATGEKAPRYRLWLFPFYFQGRDAKGVNYRAVFPLGGSLHEFLGRDEINFVLFPIRSTSKLRSLETSNWLWPVYSETKGTNIYRRRVFPFYGVSRRDGQFEKRFILWPFWTQARYDDPRSSGSGFILFPLMGHLKLTDQETWWALPPFFRVTRGEQMDETYFPWPFVQIVRGKAPHEQGRDFLSGISAEAYEKTYLWPIWGHKRIGHFDQTFWLWPFIWQQDFERGNVIQHRFQVAPFFIAVRDDKPGGETVRRHNKFWPLYSYRREGQASRFRVLELWPFAEAGGVERNWAPFWTLYSRIRNGDAVDHEALWGLYRNQKRGEIGRYWSLFPFVDWRRDDEAAHLRRWSLLKGLIGYESDDSRHFLRLLYFLKLGDTQGDEP